MNERSYLILDLVRSNVLNLNPTESILASCLFGLLAQTPIQYAGKPYYMADYKNVSVYCPILPNKVDTLRRLYKNLQDLGLIELIKIDNHVCFTPSPMLRDWGTVYKSVKAEINPVEAEKNPVEAEKNPVEAEKNPVEAEKNPQTTLLYNNINNNINDNKPENEFSGLFPEAGVAGNEPKLRGTTEPHKCLFANSRFARFEDFEKCFDKPEYEQIDIVYYYHSVADWSASKGRMQKDWIAQTRNFIRGDKEKGKLHLKPQYDNKPQGIDIAGAMEFLNNDF